MTSGITASDPSSFRYRLTVLLLAVVVGGMSQGLLLPLLSIMLEHSGVSSDTNGMNSAAMYIGVFCTMFFIEKPVKRYGYRNVIVAGIAVVADILPRPMLPTANVIASIHFSVGSMLGPALGGYGIRYVSVHSVFLFLGAAFLAFSLLGFGFRSVQSRGPAEQDGAL